jgi:catechol 2,3-dioxygenase
MSTPEDTSAGPLRIGSVTLAVRDLARTEAFYRDVIGLQRLDHEAGRSRLGAGGAAFLDLVERPGATLDDPASAGLFHTAFLLPSRTDLANWLAQLQYPVDGASDHLVSEAVYLSDPEGNGVEIYADRPRAAWVWEGPRIKMGTQRLDTAALLTVQTAAGWTGAPIGSRIGHVHLRVGDVVQAAAFYSRVVGLDVTRATPAAVFMSSGGYHHHIAVNTWRSAGAPARDPAMAGLVTVTMDGAAGVLAGIAARSGQPHGLDAGLRDPWGTELRFRVAGSAAP